MTAGTMTLAWPITGSQISGGLPPVSTSTTSASTPMIARHTATTIRPEVDQEVLVEAIRPSG